MADETTTEVTSEEKKFDPDKARLADLKAKIKALKTEQKELRQKKKAEKFQKRLEAFLVEVGEDDDGRTMYRLKDDEDDD